MRWALASIALSLCVYGVLALLLTSFDHVFLGFAPAAGSPEPAAGGTVPGAVGAPEQPEIGGKKPKVALVFDDGLVSLDEEKIAVLDQNNVVVTAFVYGRDIPEGTGQLQQLSNDGHEVGLSLFNRSNTAELELFHQVRQYRLTQTYVQGALGETPAIVRLPGSQAATSLTKTELAAANGLVEERFVPVFPDIDITSTESITSDAVAGLIADKQDVIARVDEDLAADDLDAFIDLLRENGYWFQTVSEYGELATPPAVGNLTRFQSRLLLQTATIEAKITGAVVVMATGFGFFLVVRYLTALALFARRRSPKDSKGADLPGVSVVVAVHNAESGIRATLEALMATTYAGDVEVLVIDDGSTDNTAAIARSVKGVKVLTQRSAGTVAALNEGIRRASHDMCVFVEPGSLVGPHAIAGLTAPFSSPGVGAVWGIPLGPTDTFWARIATVDRLTRSAVLARFESKFGLATETDEGVCAVRRSAIVGLGGLTGVTTNHYTDLAIAMGLQGWEIKHVADVEAASTKISRLGFDGLWRQQLDRSYGLLQAVWKHGFREHISHYRRVSLLYRLIGDVVLALVLPLIDVVLLVLFLQGKAPWAVLAWYLPVVLRIFMAWLAVVASSVPDRIVLTVVPQFLVLRYVASAAAARSLFLAATGGHYLVQTERHRVIKGQHGET